MDHLRPEPMSRTDRLLAALAAFALSAAVAWGIAGIGAPQHGLVFVGVLSGAALLLAAGASLVRLSRRRGRLARRAARLAAYNAVLAHANQIIAAEVGEKELLQGICATAATHVDIPLAAVTRPDPAGRLRPVAAAGATGYLEEIEVDAAPDRPEGRGPMAETLRDGRARFNATFASSTALLPWRDAARRWGLVASATLPLRRGGATWGVLTLYHRSEHSFTPELQGLLIELAGDVSAALDRIDLRGAEATERERRIMQQDLLRSLLGNIDLLISADDAGRLLPDFCTRLLESGLLTAAWIGRPDDQRRLQPLAWGGQAEEVLQASPALHLDAVPALREAWDQARQASDTDPESPLLRGWSGYTAPGQGQEAMVMPIRREGGPWALLVAITQAGELDADLRAILVRVAELLGLALEDIELKESLRYRQREEAHRARHDPLTELPNRLGLENHVAGALARARRKGTRVAVGLIDLDDFKPVNDRHGHEAGDRVLVELARRWQARLRESDLLGRLGGDEFVVVIEDIEPGAELTQLGAVLSRLHEAVEQPFEPAPGERVSVGMTMGLALFPGDGDDSDMLLRHADAAMYQVKRRKSVRAQWWQVWGHAEAEAAAQGATDAADGVARSPSGGDAGAPPARHVAAEYMHALARPMPAPGTRWVDALREEIRTLGELPGMRCALLMRPTSGGSFDLEDAAGPAAFTVASLLQGRDPSLPAPSTRVVASGRGRGAAWPGLQAHGGDGLGLDPADAPWTADGERLGLRATLTVPIVGPDGVVSAVLVLVGADHGQFASEAFGQWAAVLQRRWESILAQAAAPGVAALPLARARLLRERLLGGGLTMAVQPVVDLRRHALSRIEVLARLRLDDGSMAPPAEFLPLLGNAELDHVFHALLDQTLERLRDWDAAGLRVDASINLPPSTLLAPDCPRRVAAALARHDIEPRRIAFELLETGALDPQAQQDAAAALLAVGVGLVMDDLGAGHSSIQRLSQMPFDTIKVDKSLWQQLGTQPLQTITLLGTLVTMCVDLGRDVVIEGLEDRSMIEIATQLGASHGQGYAFARPMPPEALEAWVEANALGSPAWTIDSFAGALAWHWRRQHPSRAAAASANDPSPLAAFLDRQGLAGSEVWDWHDAAGRGEVDAAARLEQWLIERVRDVA